MDRTVIACNYLLPTSEAAEGAKAYVQFVAGDAQSIKVRVRSRSGRWIEKWDRPWRLGNFRAKTLPPEHPRYNDRLLDYKIDDTLKRLEVIKSSNHQ